MASVRTNEVVIATEYGDIGWKHGSANLVMHESLHAVDQATLKGGDKYSSSPEFITARDADLSSIKDNYLEQPGAAGRQETFAETGAMFYSRGKKLPDMPHLQKFWEYFDSGAIA